MNLIFGGSGYLGSNLYNYFYKKGQLLAGTYYKTIKEGLAYFDLENPDLSNLRVNLEKVNYAFICSGISKLDECQSNEFATRKINVDGTKKLIEQCFERKIIPIFFSSERVFDGRRGNYCEKDSTNPCTAYGKQKKEIEDFLLKSKEQYILARITKIFDLVPGDGTILTRWAEQLRDNQTIKCTTDQRFSLTYLGDLEKSLDILTTNKLLGIYHIASPEVFTRYELANLIKSRLKINSGQIIPCSRKDFNFADNECLDMSMSSKKFRKETGFEFRNMNACLNELVLN